MLSKKKFFNVSSPYSQAALKAAKQKVEFGSQTDPSLMTEYVRLENIKLGMVMANEQIDKTINKELSRTIATLNNFVDNFN